MKSHSLSSIQGHPPFSLKALRSAWILSLLLFLMSCSQASAISFWLSDVTGTDFHDSIYAVNEVIYLSGEWDVYDFPCAIGHIYLVPNGVYSSTETYNITNYMTRKTVQGCMGAGSFWGALLKLPPLPLGEYDLIMEENQDGQFNPGTDLMLQNGEAWVLKVVDQTLDQEVDVGGIKQDAAEQAAEWRRTGNGISAGLTAANLLSSALNGVSIAISTGKKALAYGFAIFGIAGDLDLHPVPTGYDGSVIGAGSTLMNAASMNTAAVYQDIANDPPDYNYIQPVVLEPIAYEYTSTSNAVANAIVALHNNVSEQGALGAAFLHSYEKFLGAEEHTEYVPALQQLRSAQEYCLLLSGTLDQSLGIIDEVETAIATTGWIDRVFLAEPAQQLQERVIANGFTPTEVSEMHDVGMTEAEVDTALLEFCALDLTNMEDTDFRSLLETLRSTSQNAISHYQEVAADLDSTMIPLQYVWLTQPVAAIVCADSIAEGSYIQLDGSTSTDPQDLVLAYSWDLNMDGVFGDGAAETMMFQPQREGRILIGLKVTNSEGEFDVSYRRLNVGDVNRIPQFASMSPEPLFLRMGAGTTQEFMTSAIDPDGDSVSNTWWLDQTEVANTESYAFTPTDAGLYHLKAGASDGSPHSPDTYHTWRILVDNGASAVDPDEASSSLAPSWHLFPNPANPITNVVFELPQAVMVRISVFDIAGHHVKTLIGGETKSAGTHRVTWNGRDSADRAVATGVYFYRLEAGEFQETKRMVLVK